MRLYNYRLASAASGKSLAQAASPAGTTAPPLIAQAPAGTGASQQWIIDLLSDGKTYCVKSCASHDALTFPAAAAGPGENSIAASTAAWDNLPAQTWHFSAP